MIVAMVQVGNVSVGVLHLLMCMRVRVTPLASARVMVSVVVMAIEVVMLMSVFDSDVYVHMLMG